MDASGEKIKHILRCHWGLLFFFIAAALSTFFSVDYRQSINAQYSLLLGLSCYFLITLADTQNSLRFIFLSLLTLFFLAAIFLISKIVIDGMDTPTAQVKALGTALFDVPNDALMFSIVAPLALGVVWAAGWWLRGAIIIYLFLALAIAENMQSRQAILLLLTGLVIVVALMRPRWAAPALLAGCVVGIVADGLLGWPLAHKLFMFPRTYVWHTAWAMFTDRPWTGQGPGLFKDLYFSFLAKAGYIFKELPDRRTMPWAHSLYLEQLAERGIPGFIALLAWLGASLRLAIRSWCRSGSDLMRGQAAGVLAALIVFAFAGIAETTLSKIWVTVLLFVLTALSVAIANSQDQKVAVSSH